MINAKGKAVPIVVDIWTGTNKAGSNNNAAGRQFLAHESPSGKPGEGNENTDSPPLGPELVAGSNYCCDYGVGGPVSVAVVTYDVGAGNGSVEVAPVDPVPVKKESAGVNEMTAL